MIKLRRAFMLAVLDLVMVGDRAAHTQTPQSNLVLSFAAITPPPSLPPPPEQPPSAGIIPADRNFAWNPGLMSEGGIPVRTTICATLSPSGSNDSPKIQAALNRCPAGQVVMLSGGTFIVNNLLLIRSPITLRGAGAGVTILSKTNGARPRTSTVVRGTKGILAPVDIGSYGYDAQPIVIVGRSRWPKPDPTSSQNLTTDGAQGATSITVANGSKFTAGQFVLLDESARGFRLLQ